VTQSPRFNEGFFKPFAAFELSCPRAAGATPPEITPGWVKEVLGKA